MPICIYTFVYMYTYIYIYMCSRATGGEIANDSNSNGMRCTVVCMYIYIYMHTHIYTYVCMDNTYIHMYLCVYICNRATGGERANDSNAKGPRGTAV